jgi:hypothetical protein
VEVQHPEHAAGEVCPDCGQGTLYEKSPGVLVRFTGQAPLHARVYRLQKLRCHLCGKLFTAPVPAGEGDTWYDHTVASMIGLLCCSIVLRPSCCGTRAAELVLRNSCCGTRAAELVLRPSSCGPRAAALVLRPSCCGTRAAELAAPIQMCDGLARNLLGELDTILANSGNGSRNAKTCRRTGKRG